MINLDVDFGYVRAKKNETEIEKLKRDIRNCSVYNARALKKKLEAKLEALLENGK